MIDPIGTVRRHSFTGGFELWAVVAERRGTTNGEDAFWPAWLCVWANDPAFVGSDCPPQEIEDCPLVGAIPGTPAAEEDTRRRTMDQ
jgi:hypothetical protein